MDEVELNIKKIELVISEAVPKSVSLTQASASFGMSAIRGVFFLNGSAAVAVLAKQSAAGPLGQEAILWGAAGAALAVLCSAFGYLAQLFFARGFDREVLRQVKAIGENLLFVPNKNRMAWSFYILSLTSFLFSFVCFIFAFIGFFKII